MTVVAWWVSGEGMDCLSWEMEGVQRFVSLQLADIGLDLTFALHTLLLRDVEKWICDGRDKMIEAVKLRGQEDTWKTLKYETKEQLSKFVEDMNDIGIANIETYVMGEYSSVVQTEVPLRLFGGSIGLIAFLSLGINNVTTQVFGIIDARKTNLQGQCTLR